MVLLEGLIVATVIVIVAHWAWRYQTTVLEAIAPSELLRRLEVRITAVLVHDRKVIVGLRDEYDTDSLRTLVVNLGREREAVVATLECWCSERACLQLESASGRNVELRDLSENRILALRLAA
jgi:hypothetical protein